MLPTKACSSLKGMLPKIHHPLPLNEKSTKKLLDTLTTSFRKHLDREHGWLDEEVEAARISGDKGAATHAARQASLGASSAPAPSKTPTTSPPHHTTDLHLSRPTDRHLRAILSNPLFSYDQTVNKAAQRNSTGAIKSAAAAAVAAASSSSSFRTPNIDTSSSSTATTTTLAAERDPLEIFDWAVARGLMTTKRAAGCLLAKRREAIQSSHVSAKSFMAASGAGFKVLQWLRAAGLEHDLSFVNDAQLTGVLVEFLAAEPALEAVVWQWIERLQRGQGPQQLASKTVSTTSSATASATAQAAAAAQPVSTASFLLDKLVEAKAHGGATLDDAYLAMRRGADMFSKAAGSDAQAFDRNVFWPWCGLSWMSTIKTWHLANPTPRLYESFVSIMDHDERPSIRLERAHLDLRHPTRPTPAPAQALLADDHLLQHVKASMPRVERPPGRQLKYPGRIVSMGLDTVRHLAFVGEPDEAQRVLDRLRLQFRVDQEILDTR
ncbi:hypothetical protein SCUCBS95973_008657 [Sporothrix curviconia]|uniref:Uncharacterized protein n=1 Tax=Sporothrix curviconia TaxID=1260050 RepID=A0ABP0CQZ9_9PEZI